MSHAIHFLEDMAKNSMIKNPGKFEKVLLVVVYVRCDLHNIIPAWSFGVFV